MSTVEKETGAPSEDPILALQSLRGGHVDPGAPLTPSRSLRRRHVISHVMEGSQIASALLALGVLGIVIFSVVEHAAGVLSLEFLTSAPPIQTELPGGGIAPQIVGTAVLVAIATAIAAPVGVLVALYLTEFAGGRTARAVELALDLLNGTPTVIIGLFIFGAIVVGSGQSGFAASVALAIVMLPLIARAVREVLLLVPRNMREGADALGVSHWRSVRGIILPSALGGIVTATILALARAAGETAPILFTSFVVAQNTVSTNPAHTLPSMPLYIFQSSESASPYGFERAWGAAFVLLTFVMLTSLGARVLLARSRRKLTG
jgi:phosphate transport system permease protein